MSLNRYQKLMQKLMQNQMRWLMQNQMMRRLMQILILKKNRMIQSRCLFYW